MRVVLGVLAAALVYGSIELSDSFTPPHGHLPALWLPLGVDYALVVVGGRLYALPVFAATLLEGLVEGRGDWQSLVLALGAAVAAVSIVEIARALGHARGDRASDTAVRFVASAVGAAIAAAAMLATAPAPGDAGAFWTHALLAQVAGGITAGACLRSWLRGHPFGPASVWETLAMLGVTVGLSELIASGVALGSGEPTTYLVFPPILWGALRTGRRGVSTASLAVALISAANLAAGRGPFMEAGIDPGLGLDTFVIVLTLTGLLLVGLESARRESETTLRTSEQRFRALIENASDIVTVIARDGMILYGSPSTLAILGYRSEELEGLDVVENIDPDDVARCRTAFGRMISGEEGVVVPLRFRHKDGHWVDLVSTGRNLLDDPAVRGVVVNSRDVSESKQANRELVEAEQRYRTLVERLPLVTYVNAPAPDQPPLYVSPQIEELLGYPVSAWYEDPRFSQSVIHPDDQRAMDELFVEDAEDAVRAEYRMIAADGRIVWVLDSMVTVRDEDGTPIAVQGFIVDVTERKRLEDQLRRAQRMEALGLLAGGVAHDFNNLLTAISGYAELARAHLAEPERVTRDVGEILHAAGRASDLTRQLLAFGRRQVLEHDVVDLNAIVESARPLVSRLLGETIELVCECAPDLGAIRADAGQLEQVLVNLAVNARDAMPDGGRLTIATCNETVSESDGDVPPGDYIVVSVSDTGAGIDEAVRERLFEPFFTTKGVGEGTGLGLAVVYGIVDQSGGRVVVRSTPGAGAEFRIMLPRTEDRPDAPVAPVSELPHGSETVLLVEDEEIVRHLTAEMLERQGYRVLTAASPHEALAVDAEYDLLLTDVVMPGMSGPQLAERLVGRRPGIALLFTSGYSASAVADPATLAGDLLEKPFTLEQLARKVRQALDARDN